MAASIVEAGTSAPLGATVQPGGVNFSVFAKSATVVELLLFDDGEAAQPARVIPLDPRRHRTLSLLARLRAGPEARPGVRLPGSTGHSHRNAGCGSTARRCSSTRMVSRVVVPDVYDRHGRDAGQATTRRRP